MRRFLKLSYRGAGFHGWQSQPNATSVQQTVEEALSTILRTQVPITGAGRTDTGVNARTMYAHFDSEIADADVPRIINSLNRLVGRDIAVESMARVRDDAHARFDATSRTYKYFVTHSKSPFLYPLTLHMPGRLDYEAMNRAAAVLLGTDDFTSFAKLHSDAKTNICRVTHAEWTTIEDDMHVFTITADRFLRNMVRAVVGTLVEVGRGKMSLGQFKEVIARKDRCEAGTSMAPQALFLWDITYPDDIWI